MKVAYDISRMHNLSKYRGIGTYAKNLYESIKKYSDIEIELVEKKIDFDNFDLIHIPYFSLFRHTLPFNFSKPAVVTIHDLIPLQFPKYYPLGIKGMINFQLQKFAIKKAKSIITISETVRNDIIKILKIDPEKVYSIYLAPDEHFRKITDKGVLSRIKKKYNLPDEFILNVGNVNWNKNILNTAQACVKLNVKLVIIGKAFFDKTNLNHAEKKSHKIFLERYSENDLIKILDYVENEDLVAIMNLAKCLIFASFYEGFGLPILEAQACGLPVITSNISATAEIAGKGAILVDPRNVEEITQSIRNLFSQVNLQDLIRKAGYKNVLNFSWKKTAIETVKVYKKSLQVSKE